MVTQTQGDFNELYLTYNADRGNRTTAKPFDALQYSSSVPYSIDWRTKGAVGSVKNQVQVLHIRESEECGYIHPLHAVRRMCSGSESSRAACMIINASTHDCILDKFFVIIICRVSVEPAMRSVLSELWRGRGLWHMAN